MDVKLVVAEGGRKNQTLRITQEITVVGRRQGCGLRIPSSAVSRKHCRLLFHDDLLSVEDLGSANGTFLNGQRVSKRTIVRPGDKLQVGPVVLVAHYHLSQQAIDKLLLVDQKGFEAQPAEEAEVLEAIEVAEEVADENLDEAIPVDEDDTSSYELEVADEKDPDLADASVVLAKPWQAPANENLREILSKMEEEEK